MSKMAVFHNLNRSEISFAEPLFQLKAFDLDPIIGFEMVPCWVIEEGEGYRPLEPYLVTGEMEKIPVKSWTKDSNKKSLWKEIAAKRLALTSLSPLELFELFIQAQKLGHEPDSLDLIQAGSKLKFDSNWFLKNDKLAIFHERVLLQAICDPDKLGFKEFKSLGQLEASERNALAENLNGFALKGKQLFSLIETLKDLKVTTEKSINEIFTQVESSHYESLRTKLLKLRYPKLTGLTEQLKEAKKALPQGVKLVMDETFEADTFTLELETEGVEDLIPRLEALLETARLKKLDPLYSLL